MIEEIYYIIYMENYNEYQINYQEDIEDITSIGYQIDCLIRENIYNFYCIEEGINNNNLDKIKESYKHNKLRNQAISDIDKIKYFHPRNFHNYE